MTIQKPKNRDQVAKDYLWLHLRDLPYFRALLRATEARFYDEIQLQSPILDLGCGDGHFASIAFDHPLDFGVDPSLHVLQEARSQQAYSYLAQSDGASLPFADCYFSSAVSNSVLEHIPHLESVLIETARVLKPGAGFIFCVPNQNFLPTLSVGRLLDRFGLGLLGDSYRSFFNRISRHYHCDPPETWETRLVKAGFRLERWWHYFSPAALRVLEWGHYFGLPSWIWKKLTGHWILCPEPWNLALTYHFVKSFYDEPVSLENGVYTFYIATRI